MKIAVLTTTFILMRAKFSDVEFAIALDFFAKSGFLKQIPGLMPTLRTVLAMATELRIRALAFDTFKHLNPAFGRGQFQPVRCGSTNLCDEF
jgi:hypothetical protein